MSHFFKPLIVMSMLAAATLALVYGPRFIPEGGSVTGAPQVTSVSEATPVLVEPVVRRVRRTRTEAVGTSRAQRSITLHPAVTGEVTAVNFEAGERVEPGEVLVELDRRVEALELGLARVRLQEAERELDRYERSRNSGAFTEATLDSARTAAAVARLEVRRAEVALADRTVRAPFAGHIGITDVDLGDRIGPDTAIATLDDRSALLVGFEISERFLGRLEVGDPITVATWAADSTRAAGKIFHIGTRVDSESRTFVARARILNEDDRLRPGMSFRVTLRLEGRTFPVVPEVSLRWGDGGAYVWVVRQRRAQRVAATIVQRDDGSVLVDAELAEGERVVTEGVGRMREGLAVRALNGDVAAAERSAGGVSEGGSSRPE